MLVVGRKLILDPLRVLRGLVSIMYLFVARCSLALLIFDAPICPVLMGIFLKTISVY